MGEIARRLRQLESNRSAPARNTTSTLVRGAQTPCSRKKKNTRRVWHGIRTKRYAKSPERSFARYVMSARPFALLGNEGSR